MVAVPSQTKAEVVNGHAASQAEVQHLIANGAQPGLWAVDGGLSG
jgi:hypothetical protein